MEIKNFGPVASGKISVKPMTVLTGPNNSGKSYVALLIHSVLNPPMRSSKFSPSLTKLARALLDSKERPSALERRMASDIPRHLVSGIVSDIYARIGRLFSHDSRSLVRTGSKKCTLKIRTEYFSVSLAVPNDDRHKIFLPTLHVKFESSSKDKLPGTITVPVKRPDYYRGSASSERSASIALWSMRSQMQPLRSFYFPASRSGILQGHKALSASIVRHSPYAGLREIDVPKLSGVVSDFVGDMLEIPEGQFHDAPFRDIAAAMEDEILHGEIKLTRDLLPEIKFSHGGRDFPLDLASSTVSEMAPFILYLKHIIAKPGLLIIEEPEAHLHPHNQTVLVKFLTRLVRCGMRVLITTHSPFIVEQLSNLIQTSAISHANSEIPADSQDFLMPDEVGAYSFELASSGYRIRELPVSTEEGLPSQEFVNVTARLYDDFMAIQDSIEGDKQRP